MKRKSMADDPVTEEVRRIRAEIWREAGGTPEGLIDLLDKRQPRDKPARRSRVRRRRRP